MAVKNWKDMTPSEQAAENAARAKAKGERKTADRAKLDAEIKGPGNKGKLAEKAKSSDTTAPSRSGRPVKANRTVIGGDMNIPQGDTRVFDFESKPQAAAPKPKLNIVTSDAPTEVPTKVYDQPKQKGKLAKKAVKAAKVELPGARSTAAPEIPMRPLAGQGSMVGKPVEKVTVKVSDKLLTKEGVAKWNAAKDADRRIKEGSAPQAERRAAVQAKAAAPEKVMTPAGKVEPKAPAAPKLNPADVELAGIKRSVKPSASVKFAGRIAASNVRGPVSVPKTIPQSLASKAGKLTAKGVKAAGTVTGKALIGTAKAVTEPLWKPFADFAAGHAERKAAHVAADAAISSAQGVRGNLAARAAKGWATARTGMAVGLTGGRLAVGGVKLLGEGIAASTLYKVGEEGAKAQMGSTATMNQLKSSGAKQGLNVSSANPGILRMALGGSPKIKVHDPSRDEGADGKSLSQKRIEAGEYKRLKNAASRRVIVGSYRPKGSSEQV